MKGVCVTGSLMVMEDDLYARTIEWLSAGVMPLKKQAHRQLM
jgi:hypothetical protein